MHRSQVFTRWMLPVLAAAALAAPANATTLLRASLGELVKGNESIVEGRVTSVHSYWNADHTFIYTDVTFAPQRFHKGTARQRGDLTVTLPGGTVGETTLLLVGTPDLVPGSDYMLFLNREELPGAAERLTVRDLVQGVFEAISVRGNKRFFSQAIGHPLLTDQNGAAEPVGGREGLADGDLAEQIRAILNQR